MLHLEQGSLVIDLSQLPFTSVRGGWKGMSCAWPCLSVSRIFRVSKYMRGEKTAISERSKATKCAALGV